MLGFEACGIEIDAHLLGEPVFDPVDSVYEILKIDDVNTAVNQIIGQSADITIGVHVDNNTFVSR